MTVALMANEIPIVTNTSEAAVQPPAAAATSAGLERADGQHTVRYMDDATFQRCLEKVVTVHDRLLAELAK